MLSTRIVGDGELQDRMVRSNEITAITGLSPRTVARLEKAGHFPRRLQLSPDGRAIGWRLSSILEWLQERSHD